MDISTATTGVWKIFKLLGVDDRVRSLLNRPDFDIPGGEATKKRFGSEGYRYDIPIRNTGRDPAENCRASSLGLHR